MKKTLLFALLTCLTCWTVSAQSIVLQESFEKGFPQGWTQENVSGNNPWIVESADLTYPATAVSGQGRIALRNESGESKGYKTRLITPVMRLDTVFQPILRYYHAQVKWTADFDTLRVLYRISPNDPWVTLQEFTKPVQNWTKELIDLPRPTATYQLAFEGSENMGRGIVLDSIMVRSKPDCTIPHDMSISNMVDSTATLYWQASFDAEQFQIIIAKSDKVFDIDQVDLNEAKASGLVIEDITVPSFPFYTQINGLSPKTNYVAFVRSICEQETSDWGIYQFYMKAVVRLPYFEDFNLPTTNGVGHNADWYYGNSMGNDNPWINNNIKIADSLLYAHSGSALCFVKSTTLGSTTANMAAGDWAYAATPAVNVESIQNVRMRFWASLGGYGMYRTNARAIIIGVMTDPEDINTFVAVDTLYLWRRGTPEEHLTTFENYTGEGRNIAFLSRFSMPNQFFIDDVMIEEISGVGKVMDLAVAPAAKDVTLTWPALSGVTSYNIIISDTKVESTAVDALSDANRIVFATSATNSWTSEAILDQLTTYYAYVQAEGGEWSNAKEFNTSFELPLPITIGFEDAEKELSDGVDAWQWYSTIANASPTIGSTSSYKRSGAKYLTYSMATGLDAWLVLPVVSRVDSVELEFWMRAYGTTYSNTQITAGVMTDPMDLSTFVAIASFDNATATYKRCYTDFLSYKGTGRYIALRWTEAKGSGAVYPVLDDISIRKTGVAIMPRLTLGDVTAETTTFSWEAAGMTDFQIIIMTADGLENDALTSAYNDETTKTRVYATEVSDVNTFTIPNGVLRWGRTYYAYVRSINKKENAESYWSQSLGFTLKSLTVVPLPYTEDFDYWGSGSTIMAPAWERITDSSSRPYVYSSSNHTTGGAAGVYMYSNTEALTGKLYAPKLDTDDLSKVKVSFWAKRGDSVTGNDSLFIGTATAADQAAPITWLDTLLVEKGGTTAVFLKYELVLDNWKPEMGDRIVFSLIDGSGTKTRYIHLDDISFEKMEGIAPFGFETLNVTDIEAEVTWQGESTKGWNIVLTKAAVDPAYIDTVQLDTLPELKSQILIRDSIITSRPITLTGLTGQTGYYLYLKAVDGTNWSEGYYVFTACRAIDLKTNYYFKMGFEGLTTASKSSYDADIFPECWERYMTSTSTSYMPYIYNYTSTTTSRPNVHEGYSSIKLYAQAAAGGPSWFVTPRIEANNMANVKVSFWAYENQSAQYVQDIYVGVMTDPADYSTFTPLYKYRPDDADVKLWKQVEVSFADYKEGQGEYIAFSTDKDPGNSADYYIDDIEIFESACLSPNPLLSRLTNNSVVLTYSAEQSTARIILSEDEIFQDKLNESVDGLYLNSIVESAGFVSDTTITNLGLRLENLKGDKDYYLAIRTECTESNVSPWKVVTFHTLCDPISLDETNVIDFEDMESLAMAHATGTHSISCWTVGNRTSATVTYIPYVAQSDYYYDKGKFLYIRSNVSTTASSNANGAYAIMPAVDVDDIRNVQISFVGQALNSTTSTSTTFPASREAASAISSYAGGIIVGVVTDPTDFSTFVGVDTIIKSDNWRYNETVRFHNYKGDMNGELGKYIAFLAEFDKTDMYIVDDIVVSTISPCAVPLKVKTTDVTATEATITWDGVDSKYRVMVTTEKMNDKNRWENHSNYVVNDTIVLVNDTTFKQYRVKGLSGSTPYYVYVKTLCDDGDGVWCLDYSLFVTDCPETITLPYYESFDFDASAATLSTPHCWTTFYNGKMNEEASYPTVYNTAKYGTSGNGLYWVYNTSYKDENKRPTAATLPISGNIGDVSVSFRMKIATATATPNAIIVGYASDVTSIEKLMETVHYVDTIYAPKSSIDWAKYTVVMNGAVGENMHIVLSELYVTTYGIYIDEFKVYKTPSCYAPDAISVDSIGTDRIRMSFVPHFESDNRWNIRAISEDERHIVDTTVTTTSFVLTGLKHSTTYKLYAQNDCGEGDLSDWSEEPAMFTTLYQLGDGSFYGFEEEEGLVQIPNAGLGYMAHPSLHINGPVSTYAPRQVEGTATARTGNRAMYLQVYNYMGIPTWFSLPEIAGADTLQLRFDWRATNVGSGTVTNSNIWPNVPLRIGVIDQDYNFESYRTLHTIYTSTYEVNETGLPCDTISAKNNKMFDQVVIPLPADLAGKYIVFMDSTPIANSLYIDNLHIEKKQGYQTPVIGKSTITPTSLTLNWDAQGDYRWNVYLCSTPAAFPLDSAKTEDIAFKQEGLSTNTATFEGLTPNTKYYAYLQIADVEGLGATSARRIYLTPQVEKMSADTVITFEDGLVRRYPGTTAGDTLYSMPAGWYAGNDVSAIRLHQPTARPNGYTYNAVTVNANHLVAHTGNRALNLMNVAHGHTGAYAAMPEIDADYDTLQINFYGRPYHLNSGNVGQITSINMPLVVGTMTDPNSPATFVALDTVYYNNDMGLTTTTAANTLADQGWQRFSVRLTGATGRYIAFSFPLLESTTSLQPWYIDDISFSEHTCITPQAPLVNNYTAHEATLRVKPIDAGVTYQFQVSKSIYFNRDMITDTLTTATTVNITGLVGTTTYYVRVRQACGEFIDEKSAQWSEWSARTSFFTECEKVNEGYFCNFDDPVNHLPSSASSTTSTYMYQRCYTTGDDNPFNNSTLGTDKGRLVVSTATASTSLSGNVAWYLYGNWTKSEVNSSNGLNYYEPWFAMPEFDDDVDYEGLQLTFYGLPGQYSTSTGKITQTYVGTTNLPAIVIGVMTDPEDISTFVTIDTCRYTQTLTSGMDATANNNYQFQRFTVPLAKVKHLEGRYLAFRTFTKDYLAEHPEYTSTTISTRMYIDNISIDPLNECVEPTNQQANEITNRSAKLTWEAEEGAQWVVKVYADNNLTQLIADETVDEMYYVVDGLNSATEYYWTIQQICSASGVASPVYTVAQFHTLREPIFNEYFNSNILDDWWTANGDAKDIFAYGTAPTLYSRGSLGLTSQLIWHYDANGYGINGTHISCRLNSTTDNSNPDGYFVKNYKWLISPALVLDEEHDAWLTFNAAMTRYNSAAAPDLNGDDDQFMVIISEDGGKTWARENATIWNNETDPDPDGEYSIYGKGDYVLNALPSYVGNDDQPIFVDLSKYKGKTIAVAFYAESTVRNAFNQIHIDNFHIGYYQELADSVTVCQFEDVYSPAGGFAINGDEAQAGQSVFNRVKMSALPSDSPVLPIDTLYTLVATYDEAPQVEINVTICEGEEYGTEYGFEPRTVSGVYKRKSTSMVTGCDSITTLNLTVLPRLYSEEVVDICSGTSYEFNGVSYSRTGVYVDTLKSFTGCDSITTLILTVAPAAEYEYEARVCAGTTYYFTERYPELTVSGTYRDSVKTVEGCDSIVTLHLTVEDNIVVEIEATICEGETYDFTSRLPALTQTGVYTDVLTAAGGCDSTVILHLTVQPVQRVEYSEVVCHGSSYYFTENYPAITEAGTYTDVLKTIDGCDSIVTVHLDFDVDTIRVEATINQSVLPYFYANTNITYPVGTEPGLYIDTVLVEVADDCDYILIHSLTITGYTSLEGLNYSPLMLVPNMVKVGETVEARGDFGNGIVTIEVFDMTGRQVSREQVNAAPAPTIDGFNVAGVYTVRLTNQDNTRLFVGRVVVY